MKDFTVNEQTNKRMYKYPISWNPGGAKKYHYSERLYCRSYKVKDGALSLAFPDWAWTKSKSYSISGRLARQKEILSATRSYGQKNELMRDNLPLSENMFPGPEFPSVFNNIIEMKSPLRNSHQQSYRKKEILQIQKLIFNLYI